jgi:hypothetical protein
MYRLLFATQFMPNTDRHEKDEHLSAALGSMRFLASLTSKTRLQLRILVLHEYRNAAAKPIGKCHVRGLIYFCQ